MILLLYLIMSDNGLFMHPSLHTMLLIVMILMILIIMILMILIILMVILDTSKNQEQYQSEDQ